MFVFSAAPLATCAVVIGWKLTRKDLLLPASTLVSCILIVVSTASILDNNTVFAELH